VGLLGEDRGAEFTLEKIDAMEIDYPAAMEKRARVHEEILAGLKQQQHTDTGITDGRAVQMAVATKGQGLINQHFGHATEFLVYEASPEGVRLIGHRRVPRPYCEGGSSCGEDAETIISAIIEQLAGCEVLLCSKVGFEPWEALEAAGIQPDGEHALEPIEEAVKSVYRQMMTRAPAAVPETTERRSA
jgi:nitrogen fixation protein NifB